MNSITLVGRLTKDPEIKTTQSGKEVCTITIACDRYAGKEKVADFIDTVWWGEKAKIADTYLRKGSMIAIAGELNTRKWQDKNGNDRIAYEVVVRDFSFCESKKSAAAPDSSLDIPAYEEAVKGFRPKYQTEQFTEIPSDEELPF